MNFFRLRIFWLFLLGLAIFVGHQTFIKTGYGQAILIEDTIWGIERKIIPPESFSFVFRRIIPNRIILHPIYVKSKVLEFRFVYPLPPKEILGLDDSFSVQIDLNYLYDLDPNKLPDLFVKLENKDWNSLDSYLKIRIQDLWFRIMKENLDIERNIPNGENIIESFVHENLLELLNRAFEQDGIYFKKVFIQDIYVPRIEEYNFILQQSNRYLEKKLERSAIIDEAKIKKESQRILFELEKEKLQQIAELIRKYPEIKDYLKIERISNQTQFVFLPSDGFWNESTTTSIMSEVITKKQQEKQPPNTPKKEQQFIDKTPP
ncbi:MAG: hypothetical protein NZ853_02210 [Leptospiraceae bacterium]|nr:hypothetical protein [Leptospiraceae bacterium]MDW7975960.1 hypothetical protein [Leptospiraceae bacterium]